MPITDEERRETFEEDLGLEMCARCECCSVETCSDDCGEDSCCCLDPDDDRLPCSSCLGSGRHVWTYCACDENGKHLSTSHPNPQKGSADE